MKTYTITRADGRKVEVTVPGADDDAADMDATLEAIAVKHGFPTLETRNSDSLDFHEVSAWQLKVMLQAAYDAGRNGR